ncbi:MAG TPA: CBS domain-containing protein [Bacillota bacterium]|nr:CBS domain-containing protein [Bacillota bacterium]
MKISDILKEKGQAVFTISPDEPIFGSLRKLVEYQIGSLVVVDAEKKILGIISERDILRAIYHDYENLKTLKVAHLMTTNLIIAIPEDDIDYIMGVMTQNRIRHLPVVDKDGVIGIISIGDIIKCQLEEIQVKNRYLEEYMYS